MVVGAGGPERLGRLVCPKDEGVQTQRARRALLFWLLSIASSASLTSLHLLQLLHALAVGGEGHFGGGGVETRKERKAPDETVLCRTALQK